VEPFPKGSEWAEPDAAHAAELLRAILDAPERAREVGRRAARDVARLLAPAAVGRIMRQRLENLGFRFGGDPPHA
jgi:hypothetical protein